MAIGRILHLGFDAVLISAFLAGVRRSTGLTLQPKKITDSEGVSGFIESYLRFGETVMDQGVAFMGTSKYFDRLPPLGGRPKDK